MSRTLFELENRVIIITGGAGLIGKEYVKSLVENGAYVVVGDINQTATNNLATSINPERVMPVYLDVTDPTSIQQMVRSTISRFNQIDGLVNNVALDPKFDPENQAQHTLTFENYPLDLWQKEIAVNLTGIFLCTQAVAPHLLRQGHGSIVNISSIYGMVGPDQRLYKKDNEIEQTSFKPVTYTVSKSAIFGFTKYLASYWGNKGIRVNTLTLGGVFNNHTDEFFTKYCARVPIGRMAHANEYCGALIYLLSDASSYMTGANLVIDGGWTAW
ncbi:SDR family oxidoreductase [candidate division KSB1 bacterium]|nr:SDR family oxidoreductase [candidate division KSB1 bacterium]